MGVLVPRARKPASLVLKQPRGYSAPVWFIRWYDGGKRERSTGTGDLAAAERALAQHLGQKAPARGTVAAALAAYAESAAARVIDPIRIINCVDRLMPYWGERAAGDVNERTLADYVAHRNGAAIGTIRRELGTLRAALRRAGYRQTIALPSAPEARQRWLRRHEAAKLLRAARTEPKAARHLCRFILLGLYTAARKRAILELTWAQVDLEHRLIHLNPEGRKQTKKRRPTIRIGNRLLTFLRYWSRTASPTVIDDAYGEAVQNVKRSFASASRRAGLGPDVSPHTLRHTSITWMVQGGAPLWEVAGLAGLTMEMVDRVYGHQSPEHMGKAVAALDRKRG